MHRVYKKNDRRPAQGGRGSNNNPGGASSNSANNTNNTNNTNNNTNTNTNNTNNNTNGDNSNNNGDNIISLAGTCSGGQRIGPRYLLEHPFTALGQNPFNAPNQVSVYGFPSPNLHGNVYPMTGPDVMMAAQGVPYSFPMLGQGYSYSGFGNIPAGFYPISFATNTSAGGQIVGDGAGSSHDHGHDQVSNYWASGYGNGNHQNHHIPNIGSNGGARTRPLLELPQVKPCPGGGRGTFSGHRIVEPPLPPLSVKMPTLRVGNIESGHSGRLGTPVELISNLYHLSTSNVILYKYDVVIENTKKYEHEDNEDSQRIVYVNFAKAHMVMQEFIKKRPNIFGSSPRYIFNGRDQLYTVGRKLSMDNSEPFESYITINQSDHSSQYRVVLTMATPGVVDTSAIEAYYRGEADSIPEDVLSAFGVIVNDLIGKYFTRNAGCYFNLKKNAKFVASRYSFIDFVPGFISAIQCTEVGLALNVHLRSGTIITSNLKTLTQLVCKILNVPTLEKFNFTIWDVKRLNQIVNNLQVYTKHNARNKQFFYIIEKVVINKPAEVEFDLRATESKISVAEFFRTKYNLNVDPNLPLVKTGGRKEGYLPMDTIHLVEQQIVNLSSVEPIMDDLISYSRPKPLTYFNRTGEIMKQLTKVFKNSKAGPLNLSVHPIAFKGRILPAPKIVRGEVGFLKPKNANCAMFTFDAKIDMAKCEDFIKQIVEAATNLGMKLDFIVLAEYQMESCRKKLAENVKNLFDILLEHHINLAFFIIPSNGSLLYAMMKQMGHQKYGVVTQGISGSKVCTALPRRYLENVLKKVNAKLDGQNSTLDERSWKQNGMDVFDFSDTMVVGINKALPNIKKNVLSMIIGAVGSVNIELAKYGTSLRVQEKQRGPEEELLKIDEMITELMEQFKAANQRYPSRLIIFRDSIRECQFAAVHHRELAKIRAACLKLVGEVQIVLLVVQKRHRIRFIAQEQQESAGTLTHNVRSGTIVDQTIVNPNKQEFFLSSHQPLLGTSKPSRYLVIANELKLSIDQIQSLAFYLCHDFARTSLPISMPMPLRFAELLAYMSKLHLQSICQTDVSKKDELEREDHMHQEQKIISQLNQKVQVNEVLKNRFFYA